MRSRGEDRVGVSTFDTNYLLVKAEQLPEAVAALRAAGHRVEWGLPFCCGVLGFEITQRYGAQAAFVSAGGNQPHRAEHVGRVVAPAGTGLYHTYHPLPHEEGVGRG